MKPPLLDRRGFLLAGGAFLAGCATNPVTRRPQLMLVSPEEEERIDRARAPMQFSADFGAIDDPPLAAYVAEVGRRVASQSRRRDIRWSFTAVDALYANAYTFPFGSVGVTRGMLLELTSEAELAALLGHEVAHVDARHAAARMSVDKIARGVVEGATGLISLIAPGVDDLADLTSSLGELGAGLLLAKYSRSDEGEADRLGMVYLVEGGYPAAGMVDLLRLLQESERSQPGKLATMFATHPMSDRRFAVARRREQDYPRYRERSVRSERYMEETAPLRRLRGAIVEGRRGEEALRERRLDEADLHFAIALKRAPMDYPSHILAARSRLARKRPKEALPFVEAAMAIKPGEPQAVQVRGMARFAAKEYDGARDDFLRYHEALPGEGSSLFLQGLCSERMGEKKEAADAFGRFLEFDRTSLLADYAQQRRKEWGEE